MLTDKTKGLLSYRDKKFYFLETGKIVYLGNPIPRLKQTLTIKGLLKINDINEGNIEVIDWKEAKLKNVEASAIFLNEHIRKLQAVAEEPKTSTAWDTDA